mmetsp:Transcript_11542/g.25892  ORF Transcript_11542/g.25892 Transcript_11542/m.25892 type:complete len:95 (+) Transcript_11542:88-372(+)
MSSAAAAGMAPGLAAAAAAATAATASPPDVVTTEVIQRYLDENQSLILSVLEAQSTGKLQDCAQLQQKLQQNLMYLAAIADAQTTAPGTTQMPS